MIAPSSIQAAAALGVGLDIFQSRVQTILADEIADKAVAQRLCTRLAGIVAEQELFFIKAAAQMNGASPEEVQAIVHGFVWSFAIRSAEMGGAPC
jgi:hypothetical protein